MSVIQDTRLVSQANGCARYTVLAESVTTGLTKAFSIKLSIPDEGLSYNLDTLISKKRDTQANYVCDGSFAGLTKGNQQYEEKTLDMTFGDDYNVATNDVDSTVAISIIKAMFDGSSFEFGGDTYIVVGTNGVRNIATVTNELGFKNLLLEDGKLLNPNLKNADGSLFSQANNAVTAYNDTTMGMFEALYAYSDADIKGDRFTYFLSESCDFNEGSGADINKYSISGTRYCDPRAIRKYFIDGNSYATAVAQATTGDVKEINAKLLIEVAAGGAPTYTTDIVEGDVAVVIDTADGTVEVYTYESSSWGEAATLNLTKGAKIFAEKYDTDLAGGTIADKYTYVSVGTAGASQSAVAVNWKTNASGSGTVTYALELFDWVYGTRTFELYTGE